MPISQNTALFSLLGTFYGGDGKSTFALPDLQGRAPMHPNDGGGGLSQHFLGEESGSETVTLLTSEIPLHNHTVGRALDQPGNVMTPVGSIWAQGGTARAVVNVYNPGPATAPMKTDVILPAGGSLPHNNMQPYLTLNFCIALQGVYPARP
jgi:microcystin-dependent protein